MINTYDIDLKAVLRDNPELRIERDDYDFTVTTHFGSKIAKEETLSRYSTFGGKGKPAHLYIHVPLCSYICHYCNYVKTRYSGKDETILDRWTNALLTESKAYLRLAPWLCEARIESVYFGGGTAALLHERHLRQLMEHLRGNYSLTEDCEITLEGNPDNFDREKIDAAIGLGYNRFSVGIQSLDDKVLEFVGRGHNAETAVKAIEQLVRTSYPVNIDYIVGLPYQTVDSVAKEVEDLVALGTHQVSIYRLRNADRVGLGLDIGQRSAWNQLQTSHAIAPGVFPTLEETYSIRGVLMRLLLERGYRPAPAAWWSREGVYANGICATPRNKWQNMDSMIAFGPGAYGWLTGGREDILQTHNPTNISDYLHRVEDLKEIPLSHGRYVSGREAVATALGFLFKACQKMDVSKIRARFHIDILNEEPYKEVLFTLVNKGFLHFPLEGDCFIPTLAGEALHEEIVHIYFNQWLGALNLPQNQQR
ncbi:MAG: radical SAM protein [Desulfobulbaceae bacterium]|nr:radical SAM protein [Desulfobulbaceae bacterium]